MYPKKFRNFCSWNLISSFFFVHYSGCLWVPNCGIVNADADSILSCRKIELEAKTFLSFRYVFSEKNRRPSASKTTERTSKICHRHYTSNTYSDHPAASSSSYLFVYKILRKRHYHTERRVPKKVSSFVIYNCYNRWSKRWYETWKVFFWRKCARFLSHIHTHALFSIVVHHSVVVRVFFFAFLVVRTFWFRKMQQYSIFSL